MTGHGGSCSSSSGAHLILGAAAQGVSAPLDGGVVPSCVKHHLKWVGGREQSPQGTRTTSKIRFPFKKLFFLHPPSGVRALLWCKLAGAVSPCSVQSKALASPFHSIWFSELHFQIPCLNTRWQCLLGTEQAAYSWILTRWCSIPLWDVPWPRWGEHLEKWNSCFSNSWAAPFFKWHLVSLKARGT